jgi:hypothetical protein
MNLKRLGAKTNQVEKLSSINLVTNSAKYLCLSVRCSN